MLQSHQVRQPTSSVSAPGCWCISLLHQVHNAAGAAVTLRSSHAGTAPQAAYHDGMAWCLQVKGPPCQDLGLQAARCNSRAQ